MTRPNSIYFRLIIPLGLTLLIAMLAAWAIAARLLTDTINQRLDDQLDNATAILAQGDFPFSPDLLARLERLIEARIALLDASGNLRMSTTVSPAGDALAMLSGDFDISRDKPLTLLTRDAADGNWRVAVRAIAPERDSRFHYVAAAASLAPAREAAGNAATLLGVAMLFATLVLAWFAHVYTRGISGPVSELAEMADRIADGERDIASNFDANNEIGVLARALNGMAKRLTEYEHELARQSHLAGLGDLAARLAHEIRNPLTAVKMHLQLLEESVPEIETARVRTLLDEIRRMELIVESALTLGAPVVLHMSEMDARDVVDELAELLRPVLSHRGVELQTVTDWSPRIHADAHRLRQVLLNLINNAADELAGGGVIRVSTVSAAEGAKFDFVVEDSGPGMAPDAARAAGQKPFGLGIGLTICREIVEMHGGELVQGRSQELGGAQFTISLPVPIIESSELAD